MSRSVVFDIQRFSIHDGDGIRTTIFFKGCSLDCSWCQNPESKQPKTQLLFDQSKCVNCKSCLNVCPSDAISNNGIKTSVDFSKCTDCGICEPVCQINAYRMVGQKHDEQSLLKECLKDLSYFNSSGGGITLSGGEAVLQSEFLQRFLPLLKEKNIHVLLETAGNYPYRLLAPLLPFIDHIYFDLKFISNSLHVKYTGSSNKLILKNLETLIGRAHPLTVRVPVINGINSNFEENENIAAYLNQLGIEKVKLLKYNSLWESKIPKIQTSQTTLNISNHEEKRYDLINYYSKHGIVADIEV